MLSCFNNTAHIEEVWNTVVPYHDENSREHAVGPSPGGQGSQGVNTDQSSKIFIRSFSESHDGWSHLFACEEVSFICHHSPLLDLQLSPPPNTQVQYSTSKQWTPQCQWMISDSGPSLADILFKVTRACNRCHRLHWCSYSRRVTTKGNQGQRYNPIPTQKPANAPR